MRLWTLIEEMEEPIGGKSGRKLLALAAAVIVAVPVADAFLPHAVHLAHVLVVPVALVAAFKGPRWGFAYAVAALLSIVIASGERHVLSTENVIVEMISLSVLSVFLILGSHLRERRERDMARLRRVSEAAQGVVLRALPRRVGPLELASEYRSAEAGARIGGDLYAVARTADTTRVLIGDVRGHGLSSIGDTESVLGAFRAASYRQGPLPELIASLESGFRWSVTELPGDRIDAEASERFVTAAVVEIPDDEPYARVISCGHPAPLRVRRDGGATFLTVPEPAPPLGLGGMGADTAYTVTTFDFSADDLLVLYTDGLTDTRNGEGAFYPLLERAAGWAESGSPEGLLKTMTEDLVDYVDGPMDDDMALVVIQRQDGDAALDR